MITCNEATSICDKNQYKEASFWDKIRLSIHLFLCKHCASYSKQNSTMTRLFKMNSHECKSKENCLSTEDKNELKEVLKKEVN